MDSDNPALLISRLKTIRSSTVGALETIVTRNESDSAAGPESSFSSVLSNGSRRACHRHFPLTFFDVVITPRVLNFEALKSENEYITESQPVEGDRSIIPLRSSGIIALRRADEREYERETRFRSETSVEVRIGWLRVASNPGYSDVSVVQQTRQVNLLVCSISHECT